MNEENIFELVVHVKVPDVRDMHKHTSKQELKYGLRTKCVTTRMQRIE